MRILMLAQFFPPDVGGEERHVLNLSEALARRGHEVSVATQHVAGTAPMEILPSGVTVYRFPTTAMRLAGVFSDPSRPYHPPLPDPRMTRELGRLVDRLRPDVVHAHNWIVNSAVAVRRVTRRRAFGLVLTLHDYSNVCATKRMMAGGRPCPGPGPAKCVPCSVRHYGSGVGVVTSAGTAIMRRWKERVVDHVVCVSNAVAERNDVRSAPVPSSVIPNFIPDRLTASTSPPAITPDSEFVFFAGDLSRDKGADVLLDAWSSLGPDRLSLLMVGRRTSDTPATLPPGVQLAEKWPHADVMAAFNRCTVAVVPSTWPDPCPTTVLEAMAAGRAVIASRTGGIPDMVEDGVSGILVPPGDSVALAGALRRVLADRRLRDGLAAGGRVRSRQFTASSVVARMEDVYEGALSR